LAVYERRHEFVEIILKNASSSLKEILLNQQDAYKNKAIHIAALQNDLDMLNLLIQNGCDTTNQNIVRTIDKLFLFNCLIFYRIKKLLMK
jgi:ankyrin repeat protein